MSFWSWLRDNLPGGGDAPPIGDPERVTQALAVVEELAPLVRADGGHLRLLSVSASGRIRLRLEGACTHCSGRDMTLEGLLAPRFRAALEWVETVTIE